MSKKRNIDKVKWTDIACYLEDMSGLTPQEKYTYLLEWLKK